MPEKFYTEEMKQYILKNCKGKTVKELTVEFNNYFKTDKTFNAIKSYLNNNKIIVGRKNKQKFKDKHVEFIRQNVKGITLKELTHKFNKEFGLNEKESAISNLKNRCNLRSGIKGGCFKKGMTPVNKGKKWDEYMSKEGQKNSLKTTFKKGNIPANKRSVGSERINKDGYIEIKVAEPNVWDLKHRVVYEKKHGSIPKGCNIVFADGNKQNLELDNLVLVTKAELLIMNRNKMFSENKEYTKTNAVIAKVIDTANKRGKNEK